MIAIAVFSLWLGGALAGHGLATKEGWWYVIGLGIAAVSAAWLLS